MEFNEKYISTDDSLTKPDPSKIVLSDDAFAIGEGIDLLIKKIDHIRRSTG